MNSYSHVASDRDIDKTFNYHTPTADQLPRYGKLRNAARNLALTIQDCCPPGDDREEAIHLIHLASMLANASIAIGEAQPGTGKSGVVGSQTTNHDESRFGPNVGTRTAESQFPNDAEVAQHGVFLEPQSTDEKRGDYPADPSKPAGRARAI